MHSVKITILAFLFALFASVGHAQTTITGQTEQEVHVCAENYLPVDVTHGQTDYGAAFNAADAYLQSLNTTAGVISFCQPGNHPVWTPMVETWPVSLVDGSGSVLIPQSGGASGVWGATPVTKSACTVTTGGNTVTCANVTGLTASMAVGGIGLGYGNRINGAPSGTTFQLAIPATLVVSGITTLNSTSVCGLNTIRGLATGQGITGASIPVSTTITAITAYSASNGQCITISNAATATSTQNLVGNQNSAPIALTISGTITTNITAEATAAVLTIPRNTNAAIINWAGLNYLNKVTHLSIQDPAYRTLTGVEGFEVWGQDSFVAEDLDVRSIKGTCLTLGGFDSLAPIRESFFSDVKCVNDGDNPTAQPAVLIAANGVSNNNDEPNDIKFSGGEIVYPHGEGVTIGTYISGHQGSNGPRLIFFSDNWQTEQGTADSNAPDVASPNDVVHTMTGSGIYFSGAQLAVPGYGRALYQQDNVSASNSYQVNSSSLISAGNRVTCSVAVVNGSANITLPSTCIPLDNTFDGVGVQIAGVDYWFLTQNSVSGTTATMTQAYQGTTGAASMVIGAGGFFFFNTATPGVLDTRTSLGDVWTQMDPTAISLLGFGTPIATPTDQGSLPGRGEADNLGFESYGFASFNGNSEIRGYLNMYGTFNATGIVSSNLLGQFSNPNNVPITVTNNISSVALGDVGNFTCPNLAASQDCTIFLGLNSNSNNNSALFGWDNAATPFGFLGMYGTNHIVTWNTTGVTSSVGFTAPHVTDSDLTPGQYVSATTAGKLQSASPPGLVLIQKQTLVGTVASVTFSAIPQTYTNLVLVVSAQSNAASDTALQIQYNGDTAAHYTTSQQTIASGTASSSAAGGVTSGKIGLISNTTGNGNNMAGTSTATIYNYTATFNINATAQAALFLSSGAATQFAGQVNWQGSAAVTSITLIGGAAESFLTGSVFSLYGQL
jgi:hypothetical protein